jgi:hypothetical protein
MGTKLRKMTLAVLVAGSAAVLVAPPAEANRGNGTTTTTEPAYVPPYGQNVHPEVPDPYAPVDSPVVAPTVVSVDLPAVTDPNAGLAGEGDRLGPAPSNAPTVENGSQTRPEPANNSHFIDGILSRTGAETLPLARAGVALLALGLGLVVLARRRRVDAASAASGGSSGSLGIPGSLRGRLS